MINIFNKNLNSIVAPLRKINTQLEQFVNKNLEEADKKSAEITKLNTRISEIHKENTDAVNINNNIKSILGVS